MLYPTVHTPVCYIFERMVPNGMVSSSVCVFVVSLEKQKIDLCGQQKRNVNMVERIIGLDADII